MPNYERFIKLLERELSLSNADPYSKNRIYNNGDRIADLVISGKFEAPHSIEVHPINKCINDCVACIGQNIKFSGKQELNYAVMKDIVEYATESDIPLILSGNHCEPFCNKDFKKILHYILDKNELSKLLLFTTTYHFDKKIIDLLSTSDISIYLAVGLYGYSERSYLKTQNKICNPIIFKESLKNTISISKASEDNENIYIDIHYLATPASTDDFEGLKNHIKSLLNQGVSRFLINPPLRPINHTGKPSSYGFLDRKRYDRLKKLLSLDFKGRGYKLNPFIRDRRVKTKNPFKKCYVQYFFPTLGPDSGVYPCCYTTSPQGRKKGLRLGKLGPKVSFNDIWYNAKNRDFNPSKCCPTCSKPDKTFNLIIERVVKKFYR